jgi:nicotinamide-nucleotide amidase
MLAAILTIGNEVVCGDVQNTNATWLAQRLEALGVRIVLTASVPDEVEMIAEFIRRERDRVAHLVVTGGLGGTPDDITREALAAAFGVKQVEVPELAADLRARFPKHPDYAARWALLPAGSRPLTNPHGGAPGFAIDNVWVLPGLPSEMEAMFDLYAEEFRGEQPISSWRRAYRTRESDIVNALAGATVRWPQVRIGSYPRFLADGPEVEIVLKSARPKDLAAAVAWLEPALAEATAASTS